MSNYDENNPYNEPSVDELIRSAKEELEPDSLPLPNEQPQGNTAYPEEPVQYLDTPDRNDGFFEPDFGHAFDDYGEYTQEQAEPAEPAEPERVPPRRRHAKRVRFPVLLKIVLWLAVIAAVGVAAATFGWYFADDVLALTRPDQEVEIIIEESDDVEDITQKLKEAGAVKYDWLFKLYCKVSKSEEKFDPGVYTINLTYDYHALVNNLMATAANRETTTVMIMEGLNCAEAFKLLEDNGVCTVDELERAASEYEFKNEFLKGIPLGEPNRLEGYLFPDTYEFYLKDTPENVLAKMLDNFDRRVDDELLEQVEESGYSLHDIVIIASIIEGEAANDTERADVSSVIYNRLNNWEVPLLGMDSTVFYAAMLEDTTFSLELDSPYNTYMYRGLPAGPIDNPGLNSIRAALNPAETDYYYFATATDGLNRFFVEQDEFNKFLNSEDFQG